MLLFSMGVSLDGYIADRGGDFGWGAPDPELFAHHLDRVRELGRFLCGRRLHELMLVWETDPSFADTDDERAFAEVWSALPKVVFSRSIDRVEGNARLARAPLAEEVAAAHAAGVGDVEIGGADLAGQAFALGLIDELRLFRSPVVLGGGTPALPPVAERVELELLEVRTFASRTVLERYRVAR